MNVLRAIVKRTGYTVGRMVRETGITLDVRGSKMTKDIAYLEPLSRHRNIMPLYDINPILLYDTYVAPNASIIGEVFIGAKSTVWYGAVLRADLNAIRIGNNSSIGDQTVITTTPSLPVGIPASVNIGNNVTIENNCNLYSCAIDDGCVIGFKSIIMEGARIERGSVIGPNSVVPPGRLIPAGTHWAGNPVEYVRDLTEEEIQSNLQSLKENSSSALDHQYEYLSGEPGDNSNDKPDRIEGGDLNPPGQQGTKSQQDDFTPESNDQIEGGKVDSKSEKNRPQPSDQKTKKSRK